MPPFPLFYLYRTAYPFAVGLNEDEFAVVLFRPVECEEWQQHVGVPCGTTAAPDAAVHRSQ